METGVALGLTRSDDGAGGFCAKTAAWRSAITKGERGENDSKKH
jgi:hypothetical protein